MSAADTIIAALLLPLAGAVGILLASRVSANLRESVTLLTSLVLAFTVWSLDTASDEWCASVEEPGDWAGRSLLMETGQGALIDCEIVTLPFYDPEKRSPRGLDQSAPM